MSSGTDYTLEDDVHLLFTTRAFDTGIPGTLSASTVAVYEDVTATPILTSVAVTEDLNSITGLNAVTIAATAANGFNVGGAYHVVIEAGTVDSVSVVGEVIGNFTIGHSAAAVDLANGTDGLGAIKAETALILGDTGELQTDWADGGRLDLIVDAVLVDTNSLNDTKVPDTISLAAINAEVDTALSDIGLDHLISSALPTNWATDVAAGSVFDNVADDGTAAYDRTTDSLQAVRDHIGDGTNLTEAGGTGDQFSALNNLSAADVNAQVLDVIDTDTFAELSAVPAANAPLSDKINWMFALARNKITQTDTTQALRNDGDSLDIGSSTVSDSAGTFTRGKYT